MDPQQIDVSIIIVNWNTKQYLVDCVESLKRESSGITMEIIVVDNGSADGSQEALRASHPDVLLIENDANLGFSKANNIGIEVSRGRYVCLVNTDVIALDSCVPRMVRYMDADADVGAVGPRTVNREMELRENCRNFPTLNNACADYLLLHKLFPNSRVFPSRTLKKSAYGSTHSAEVLSGCFLMVRREAMEEVGVLDERFFFYGEDTDWCKRFAEAGWKLTFLSAAQAIHFGGASSAAYPVKYQLAMEKADLQYWRKHNHPLECALYVLIKDIYHLGYGIAWLALAPFKPAGKDRDIAKLKVAGHFTCLGWLLFNRKAI